MEEAIIFYVLAAITLLSALGVVSVQRPLYNALFMIVTMIGLAGLYVALHAEFIAMVQLIVYAGAVMVLFLFVIMLLNLERFVLPAKPLTSRWLLGAAGAALIAVIMIPIFMAYSMSVEPKGGEITQGVMDNTATLGKALFTKYLVPFEVASILLLAAIIGAVILVRRPQEEEKE
jgi:NADH-quinone oxidoreductase subunit J